MKKFRKSFSKDDAFVQSKKKKGGQETGGGWGILFMDLKFCPGKKSKIFCTIYKFRYIQVRPFKMNFLLSSMSKNNLYALKQKSI